MSNKPTPVYVDGRQFPSIIFARIELRATNAPRYGEFSRALRNGLLFHGHELTLYPPRKKEVRQEERRREHGAALLRGHETHRIGHYVDSRW